MIEPTNTDSQIIEAAPETASRGSRRLWRWMVGMLLVVLIAFAIAVYVRYQRQITVITQIDQYGSVFSAKTYPDWVWRCLGRKRMRGLEPIEAIRFIHTRDEALKLAAQTNVRRLYVQTFSGSEAAVAATSRMTSLHQLLLWPNVDDMRHPATFPETLAAGLADLPHLETLNLRHFRLSPAALQQLQESRSLREIVFNRCQVAVPGVSQLAELKSLRELHIDTPSGGPELLKELSHLTQLTELHVDLYALEVNDDDLQVLSRLKSLKTLDLNLRYTDVTRDGIDKLQKALPACHIQAAIGKR